MGATVERRGDRGNGGESGEVGTGTRWRVVSLRRGERTAPLGPGAHGTTSDCSGAGVARAWIVPQGNASIGDAFLGSPTSQKTRLS